MMGRGLLLVALLATCALSNPVNRDEATKNDSPPTAIVKREELAQDIVQDQENVEITTEVVVDEDFAVRFEANEQFVTEEPQEVIVVSVQTAELQDDKRFERSPEEDEAVVETTTARIDQVEQDIIVKKSEDVSVAETNIQQDSSITEEETVDESASVDSLVTTEVSVALEEENSPVEAERMADESSVLEEVQQTTVTEKENEETIVTEDPTNIVSETEAPITSSFRNENIDVQELTTEEEDVATTTEIIAEERLDTATDTYFEDSTSIASDDVTTIAPEEIFAAESIVREIQSDAVDVSDDEVDELSVTDSSVRNDDHPTEITTEPVIDDIEIKVVDLAFVDAAPISVVEIQQDGSSDDSAIPEDSVPIEIVEISNDDDTVTDIDTTTPVADETREESIVEPVTKDDEDSQKKITNKIKIQSTENKEETKPTIIDDEYWINMQQTDNTIKSNEAPATAAPEEESKNDIQADVSEPLVVKKQVENETEETPIVIQISEVDVVEPAASTIDEEMDKVAQKYGLTSVEKSKAKVDDADTINEEADVVKEDPIYLANESESSFQDSNDLQRRLSFGNKVVRFVRSHW